MSAGRGRGYGGRHAAREPRPGDVPDLPVARVMQELTPDHPAVRVMPEFTPRVTEAASEREDRPEPHKLESQLTSEEDAVLKELLTIDDQYAPLLVLLEQFCPGDDGIAFNRKLRNFESTITSLCPDETRLEQAFATFRAAALRRASVSRRLATAGACFTRQPRQQPLRAALLNVVMQGTYTKLDVLERANHTFLINAANLMGDYFAEARLSNGSKVHILAAPLLQYLRALLASDELRAHRSLATQLMQNGRELLSVMPNELDDLSISIRQRLLSPPTVSIVWLILSADISLNKYLPLPVTLQQFYAAQLQFTDDSNYSEVSYGSWKNTEKIDVEKVGSNITQLNISHDEDGKPKLRPILGAGAGLLRQDHALPFDSALPRYDYSNDFAKSSLSNRYDLNSWRQTQNHVEASLVNDEPVFNPNVLPPNLQNPANIDYSLNTQQRHPNYLQQGDGVFITSHQSTPGDYVQTNCEKQEQPDKLPIGETQAQLSRTAPEQLPTGETQMQFSRAAPDKLPIGETQTQFSRAAPDKVDNELQKSRRHSDRDEHGDARIRSRQRSSEPGDEREPRDLSKTSQRTDRANRRNSTDSSGGSRAGGKPTSRRHVTEVPRNHKYWDHDDRCDRHYLS